jgi:thiosulfate/3-mercaptopyruvate sulfurtransferase
MEAQDDQREVLVGPDWIPQRLDDPSVRIVELDVSAASYKEGHIPGAILWNAYTDLRHPDYTPITKQELEGLLSASGLTPDMRIVFYGYAPHLGFWLMRAYGHDRVHMMNGPRDQWLAAGHSWSLDIPASEASHYTLATGEPRFISSKQEVQDMIGRQDVVLLDTRSEAEYKGERFWPSGATAGAGRPGHLPGAVHVHIDLLRTPDGSFRPEAEMRDILESRGVTPESKVVTYCTIGNRASQAWFALNHLLGYDDVHVYYGSWAEWGTAAA